jgi:hypothetical protein
MPGYNLSLPEDKLAISSFLQSVRKCELAPSQFSYLLDSRRCILSALGLQLRSISATDLNDTGFVR